MKTQQISENEIQAKYEKYCEKTYLNELSTPSDMRRHNYAMGQLHKLFKEQIENNEDLITHLFPKLWESESVRVRCIAAQHAMLLGYDMDKAMEVLAESWFISDSRQLKTSIEMGVLIYINEHPGLGLNEKWKFHVSRVRERLMTRKGRFS